jgi:drug/metabolite transporter (DMT)-like permease
VRDGGATLVVTGALAYSTIPTLSKLVYENGGDPLGLLSTRFVLIALVLLPLATTRVRRGLSVLRRTPLLAVSVTVYLLQTLAFFYALELIDASLAVLLLYAYPVFVVLIGHATATERLTRRSAALLVLITGGVVLCVGVSGSGSAAGIALGAASAALFAAHVTVSKVLLERRLADEMTLPALFYGACAPVFIVLGLVDGMALPSETGGSLALAALIAMTFAGTLLFFAGLRRVSAGSAALLCCAEPVAAIALAALVLDERFTALQALGAGMVVAGLVLTSVSMRGCDSAPTSSPSTSPSTFVP